MKTFDASLIAILATLAAVVVFGALVDGGNFDKKHPDAVAVSSGDFSREPPVGSSPRK